MNTPSRRTALKGAAAFLTGFAAGSVPDAKAASESGYQMEPPTEPDPIFAAITKSSERYVEHYRACEATDEACARFGDGSPEALLAEERQTAASAAQEEAIAAFLETAPTTLPGVLAYLQHLGSNAMYAGVVPQEHEYDTMIRTLSAAITAHSEHGVGRQPTPVPPVVTEEVLQNYHTWLFYEHRKLTEELGLQGFVCLDVPSRSYHFPTPGHEPPIAPASSRATLVLSAVGCPMLWDKGAQAKA